MLVARPFAIALLFGATLTFAGCSRSRPPDVPESASLKAQGDNRIVYTADDSGTLYVSDGNSDILWSGPVHRGDRVVLDPSTDKLTINDRVVSSRNIDRSDHKMSEFPSETYRVPLSSAV